MFLVLPVMTTGDQYPNEYADGQDHRFYIIPHSKRLYFNLWHCIENAIDATL